MSLKLKLPSQVPPTKPGCRSDALHPSPVPSHVPIRSYYLEKVQSENDESIVPPPLISCSDFVPRKLVDLLMRRKKSSALGVKFESRRGHDFRLDEITDVEGAMHSFVTPVIERCEMEGDYRFDHGHGVAVFDTIKKPNVEGQVEKLKLTRSVVLSASIQLDFETAKVMLLVCKLDARQVLGRDLGHADEWNILSVNEKQDGKKRMEYDDTLRAHMVYHLVKDKRLPPRSEVTDAMDGASTVNFLNTVILGQAGIAEQVVGKYSELSNTQIVSLELLFNAAVEQARNELSALEALCPQGYVYTYDPASIFAAKIGPQILNRLMLAAVKHLSAHNQFSNMRIFAFNDYADRKIMSLVEAALENQIDVIALRKEDLFKGEGGMYDVERWKGAEGAMLVVHNNSDGFGQNIETEGLFGSLDGAIGASSSAAASLERNRKDLLDFVF